MQPSMLATTSLMILSIFLSTGEDRWKQCLPTTVKETEIVVSTSRVRRAKDPVEQNSTVGGLLREVKARCRRGKLVDRRGREIYFFRVIGCWGNPPADYQEQLKQQQRELARLGRKYRVIQIQCAPLDPRQLN